MPDQRVRVRVWADEGPGRAPEQRTGVLSEPLPQTAVCFSGGGTRSMAATVGQLRGLAAGGLLERVGYLSSVSGSSWAVVPYLYAADGGERLGVVTRPEHLTLERLNRLSASSLLQPATHGFGDTLESLAAAGAVRPDEVWIRAVGETFLSPAGLYDPLDPIGFGPALGLCGTRGGRTGGSGSTMSSPAGGPTVSGGARRVDLARDSLGLPAAAAV